MTSLLSKKHFTFWTLLAFSLVFFLLRFPSLYEPYWYGDEGVYQVIGRSLQSGKLLYRDIWDNKPPLLYIVYALFNGDQFWVRFVSLLSGLGAVLTFYFLSTKIFKTFIASLVSSFLFVIFFGLPIIEGNIANAENFMLFPSLLGMLLLFLSMQTKMVKERKDRVLLFFAGISIGISTLFKIVGIFDALTVFVFVLFLIVQSKRKNDTIKSVLNAYWKRILPFVVGFTLPVLLTTLFFLVTNSLFYFLEATLTENVTYVGWHNDFFFPQGFLFLKTIVLVSTIAVLFYKKQWFSKETLFVVFWLLFSLFSAFFSQRPYTHYQLLFLPSLSLLAGYIFVEMARKKKLLLALILSGIIFLASQSFNRWTLQKSLLYYQNFTDFITNKKSVEQYQSFFDNRTPRDYEVAAYIKKATKPGQEIFLWGNSAQIYTLSNTFPPGRFTVAYHISTNKNTVTETQDALDKKKPQYVVLMPDEKFVPIDLSGYTYKVTIGDTHIYERTF